MDLNIEQSVKDIIVVGVGGCGGSTLGCIASSGGIKDVELLAINTDKRALNFDYLDRSIQIGPNTTNGLGAGAIPEIGAKSALESELEIKEALQTAEIIFLTAGMGGGTGTGASPEVARIAQELGIPIISIVTRPFSFEGKKKAIFADEGIKKLHEFSNAVIVLPNDSLSKALGGKFRLIDAFEHSNLLLTNTLRSLTSTLSGDGLINIDMNDFKAVVNCKGKAVMGVSYLNNQDNIEDVIDEALYSPFLEGADISEARAAVINITADNNISIDDFDRIGQGISSNLSKESLVVVGLTIVPELKHDFEIMFIATGIPS